MSDNHTAPEYFPIADRVLVKRDPTETTTEGGLLLAEAAQEAPVTGTILACGPKCVELAKGQRVIFAHFGGSTMPGKGNEDLLILREDDCLVRVG